MHCSDRSPTILHPLKIINKKSSTLHKIPYLPNIGFNFDELIFNRLNCSTKEPVKSIFFIKGHPGRLKDSQERNAVNTTEIYKKRRPELTISVTLDGHRNNQTEKQQKKKTQQHQQPQKHQQNQKKYQPIQKQARKTSHKLSPWKQLTLDPTLTRYTPHKHQQQENGIIGNRTILNFRTTQQQGHKKALSLHKTKIKFGTFIHPIGSDRLCPWGYQDFDKVDDNTI